MDERNRADSDTVGWTRLSEADTVGWTLSGAKRRLTVTLSVGQEADTVGWTREG